LKGGALLREVTQLKPMLEQDTRWLSTFNMLHRYDELDKIIKSKRDSKIARAPDVADVTPSQAKSLQISELVAELVEIEKVVKQLQATDINLADVRDAFDGLIAKYPGMENYLSRDADIVLSKHFENAVVKVLMNQESLLSPHEKNAIKHPIALLLRCGRIRGHVICIQRPARVHMWI